MKATLVFLALLLGTAHTNAQNFRYLPDSVSDNLDRFVPRTGNQKIMSYDAADHRVIEVVFDHSGIARVDFIKWEYTGFGQAEPRPEGNFTIVRDEQLCWHARPGSDLEAADQKTFDTCMRELMRRIYLSHPKNSAM